VKLSVAYIANTCRSAFPWLRGDSGALSRASVMEDLL